MNDQQKKPLFQDTQKKPGQLSDDKKKMLGGAGCSGDKKEGGKM